MMRLFAVLRRFVAWMIIIAPIELAWRKPVVFVGIAGLC